MDNFKAAADRCVDRGDNKTARRILIERKIAFKVIDIALREGHSVSVCDGDEWTVKKSTNKKEIRSAMFTTDEDVLAINHDGLGRIGTFWFVYGNDGYDVISDYTVTEFTEKLMDEIQPMIDKIESMA